MQLYKRMRKQQERKLTGDKRCLKPIKNKAKFRKIFQALLKKEEMGGHVFAICLHIHSLILEVSLFEKQKTVVTYGT